MNVLHMLADWKWTGPAEPVLDLCLELRKRGHTVHFACQSSEDPNSLPCRARRRGLAPVAGICLDKRLRIVSNARDVLRLAKFIDREGIGVVHVHQTRDHILGALAARRARSRPIVVRTNHRGEPLPGHFASRFLTRTLTDGYVVFSERLCNEELTKRGLDAARVFAVEPGMDLERYQVAGNARNAFGIGQDDFLVGMALRIQKHRRFDVVLEAVDIARRQIPNLRLLVLGRGTHRDELAIQPARKMGLDEIIKFAGYVREGYLEAINAFDVMLYTVPGSDGTCRALREAMALGKPSIVSNLGLLPELVAPNCGRVVELRGPAVAEAIVWMARHPKDRAAMGRRAFDKVRERFTLAGHTRQIEAVYRTLLANRRVGQ